MSVVVATDLYVVLMYVSNKCLLSVRASESQVDVNSHVW